jgi:hypothetical protein
MFQDVNASVTYKFFDGKDEQRSIDRKRIGLTKINDVYCELLNYFSINSDGGVYCKTTLDVIDKEYDSLGLGTYLEFSDWDEENVVLFSDLKVINFPVSFSVDHAKNPAALVYLAKLKKGLVMFMENKSDGYDVNFDFNVKGNKAKIGSYVIHSDKILRPADRVENNLCIYMINAYSIDQVKDFYKKKTEKVMNVNPHYHDFKVLESDSLIMAMMRGVD